MIEIDNYRCVKYSDFQKELNAKYKAAEKSYVKVASEIKVKSHVTVKNALNLDSLQMVSDELLTKVMKSVGLSGFVIWIFGKKYYYIKK